MSIEYLHTVWDVFAGLDDLYGTGPARNISVTAGQELDGLDYPDYLDYLSDMDGLHDICD